MERGELFIDPRTVLKRYGLLPKRSFGQNFLVSSRAVEVIGRACVDEPGREVLEIGPGVGTLTHALLALGGRVTAIERDRDMCSLLRAEHPNTDALELVEADAGAFDYAEFLAPRHAVIAGNLPYNITGLILRQLMSLRLGLMRAVLMVQQEVSERLLAPPSTKARGALSVLAQGSFAVTRLLSLPPGAFHPPPKVHSAVVRLVPLPQTVYDPLPFEVFEAAVRAAFAARRKTLRNALVVARIGSPDACEALLVAAQIDPGLRAEALPLDAFVRLAKVLPADLHSSWALSSVQ